MMDIERHRYFVCRYLFLLRFALLDQLSLSKVETTAVRRPAAD
jgi:hypothetical protein